VGTQSMSRSSHSRVVGSLQWTSSHTISTGCCAGFDNGSNVGVEVSGPFGAEAIGDFPEDDTGTQRLFGAVVSWRNSTVGEEDEHVSSASLDDELQLLAGLMGRCDAH
jgi:hypothetical protein